jgi:hypothetical protein
LTRQNERCHENASDCLRLDRCGGDAGDASTCRLLTRLPSRRTMPGVLRSVPAILRSAAAELWSIALLCSAPAILWSIALLCSAPAILRLRLGRPIDPVFRADSVVLAISAEKDGNLRVVYARIGRCQGRPAWRGAQAAVAWPYPAVTCHVGVKGGLYAFEPPAGRHRYTSRAALQLRCKRAADWAPLHDCRASQDGLTASDAERLKAWYHPSTA